MYRSLFAFVIVAGAPVFAFAQDAEPAPAPPAPAAEPAPAPGPQAADPTLGPPPEGPAPAPAPAPGDTAPGPGPEDRAPAPAPMVEPDVDIEVEARDTSVSSASFMDTRLNFTFTNEDVLADPDEPHVPNVPGTRFGRPNSLGTLFFDNYDTRFSGFETLSHAVLYKKEQVNNWDIEGALVLRVNDLAERDIRLSDAGSYINATYWLDPDRVASDRVTLTAFPTSSDRFRLGYSYRLSWGGSDEFRRSNREVPGLKLQYENDRVYGFVGAKSAILLDRTVNEERAVVSGLAGGGIRIGELVRLEVNGGVFDRGTNEQQDVLEEHVILYGVSTQLSVEQGIAIGSSIDYKLYRNSPEGIARLFSKPSYPGGLAWLVATEATVLGQTLKDPERSGSTTTQMGYAGDLQARVKIDYTRIHATLQFRDLAFILHSTPSLPSYTDFPEEYETAGNFFAAAGVDHHLPAMGLTLGGTVGIDRPASLTTPKAIPGDITDGESTVVVRNEGDLTILPPGEDVVIQFATKLTARLDIGDSFASILDVYYSRDPNRTRLRRDGPDDLLEYEFDDFDRLGFNLTLQARF